MKNFQEENKTLHAILNSLAEGVVVADKDGKFLFINPAAEKIVGMGAKNVKPEEWASAYGSYHLDKVTLYSQDRLPLARAIKGEEVKHEVIFIRNRKRPEGLYIDVSASPLKDNKGVIRGGTIIFRDITKRKLAEGELRKLSKAVQETADSVLITDKSGVIEYVNPAFEKTTGYRRKEVIGKTPRILKSEKHDSRFYKNLWDTIKNGKTFYGRILNKKKNNELYWSAQTITPMKDKEGNITNYVSLLRDITETVERQKQEVELKISQEQIKKLAEMDKMKSHFFANISHEFRTPLTLILGPSENIITKTLEQATKNQAGQIKKNASLLLDLINQLLELSKIESGKLKLKASCSNIVSFIRGITMSFESFAAGKKISLKVESENKIIDVYFDEDKLSKALTNLLSNAFKYTPEGGEITVTLTLIPSPSGRGMSEGQGEGKVHITVSDTGVGISEKEIPKLFDRFYQVDSSQTREHSGTGIGLALTKELIELHKGSIRFDSKEGEGAKFTIELPLGRDHLTDDEIVDHLEQEQSKDVILGTTLSGTKNPVSQSDKSIEVGTEEKTIILIVEDNPDVREYIRDSLGDEYQIDEAVNGEEGVSIAEKIIPDLIISDVMMPKMDGNELTRVLKNDEKTSHIPIILLTAKAGQESKLEGFETGADAYLTKPFDRRELQVRIKNLLNIRNKLQQKYSKGIFYQKTGRKKLSDLDEKFMSRVLEVIENHISEEEFSIGDFDKEIGMGRVQIFRKLKALTGKSPSRYIRSVRLARAKNMIEEKKGNVSEIAYSVGFSSPQYFTKCFKEEFGFPPSDLIN